MSLVFFLQAGFYPCRMICRTPCTQIIISLPRLDGFVPQNLLQGSRLTAECRREEKIPSRHNKARSICNVRRP